MQQRPRMIVSTPAQIRLLGVVSVGLDDFKKGDIITLNEADAKVLIDNKKAEAVRNGENLESVNRFELTKDAAAKAAQNTPAPTRETITAKADDTAAQIK